MEHAAGRQDPSRDRVVAPEYRRLPEPVRLVDTVTSVRGDGPPEASGEPNDFIAAAVNAGG